MTDLQCITDRVMFFWRACGGSQPPVIPMLVAGSNPALSIFVKRSVMAAYRVVDPGVPVRVRSFFPEN